MSHELRQGKAAEHLVCYDLLCMGHDAFLADQGLPYDVLLDLGQRVIRVQVKSTQSPIKVRESVCYNFSASYSGKRGKKYTSMSDFDMLALVALDCRKIAYLLPTECEGTTRGRLKAQIRLFVEKPKTKLPNRCRSGFWDEPRLIDQCPISRIIEDI